jgi:hypothetical protein
MQDEQETLSQHQCMVVLRSLVNAPDARSIKARHAELLLLNSTTFSWRHGNGQKLHERGRELGQLLVQATSHGLSLLQQQAAAAGAVDLQLADILAELCEALCDWVCPQAHTGNPSHLQQLYADASGLQSTFL